MAQPPSLLTTDNGLPFGVQGACDSRFTTAPSSPENDSPAGHIGLGGTIGWADPETGSAFGYVHNRLLTLLLFDIGSFAGLAALLNSAVVAARRDDPLEVPHFGAPYSEPRHEQAASGA